MSTIFTLTLNPALDKSTEVGRVIPDSKLRCAVPKFDPGGGGINVSRAIRKLGGDSVAVYPAGGPGGQKMEQLLKGEGVNQVPVPSTNWTRENFIVVESDTNQQFRFGMPGPELFEHEWKKCMEEVTNPSKKIDYLVGSGSMPHGVPVDFYAQLARTCKKNNTRFVLDTSGEALEAAVDEGIFLLKPNLKELSYLVGRKLDTVPEQEDAAMEIVRKGKVEVLVVSLGPAGALLATADGIFYVSAPSVKKRSTVGAGDSMVGGMVYMISQGKSYVDAIRYGVASGTAATMNPGTELCKKEDVENLYNWILTNARR